METARFLIHPARHSSLALESWDSPRTLVLAVGTPSTQSVTSAVADLGGRFAAAKFVHFRAPGVSHLHGWGAPAVKGIIARFRLGTLKMFSVGIKYPIHSFQAGESLSQSLLGFQPDLRGALIFLDRRHVNADVFLSGFNSGDGARIPIIGGLSDGTSQSAGVSVTTRGKMQDRMIVAVGLYGKQLRMQVGVESGFSPCGHRWMVTRSSGSTLLELDGAPALVRYKGALGPLASRLPAVSLQFPLGMEIHAAPRVLRSVLGIDLQANALLLDGGIRAGTHINLMYASPAQMLEANDLLGRSTAFGLAHEPYSLGIGTSCVLRHTQLGVLFDEERQRLLNVLPPAIVHTTFYSKGLFAGSGKLPSNFHGQSAALALIGEEDGHL